jgi:type VI secretion system protein ImpB
MADSTQKKLERVRPPRIQISYEVETGGAIEMKELPFLMGVMADLSGHAAEPLPRLKERKFVEITPDNFDDTLASMKPRLQLTVENKLSEDADAPKLAVELNFRSMDDFSPEQVAEAGQAVARIAGAAHGAREPARQPADEREARRSAARHAG